MCMKNYNKLFFISTSHSFKKNTHMHFKPLNLGRSQVSIPQISLRCSYHANESTYSVGATYRISISYYYYLFLHSEILHKKFSFSHPLPCFKLTNFNKIFHESFQYDIDLEYRISTACCNLFFSSEDLQAKPLS